MSVTKSGQMNALRKMQAGPGLSFESVPVPSFGPHGRAGARPRRFHLRHRPAHIRLGPLVGLAHSCRRSRSATNSAAIVEKVGEEVTSVKPGDFVSAEMHVNCGHCRPCRMGQPHVCQNVKIIGIDADGCFAEFVSIPVRNIWKVDPAIPEHYAAILDPLGNAVHTVLAGEIAGQNVVVTGRGPIGLMAIAVARACGCAIDFRHRSECAPPRAGQEMGADVALDPARETSSQRVREATDGAGVDVLLEMSGNPAAIHQGFQMLRSGGRASLLGIPADPVHLRSGERRHFQRRHGPGNLRPKRCSRPGCR